MREYITSTCPKQSWDEFEDDLEIDPNNELEWMREERYRLNDSFRPWGSYFMRSKQIPSHRILRFGERYNRSYYVAIPDDKNARLNTYSCKDLTFYRFSVELWKYVTRIFLFESQDYPTLAEIDAIKLHLQRRPPASGIRIINAYGGHYVTKAQSKINRGYYEFPTEENMAIVKKFMLDYCLYKEEEK